MQGSLFGNDAPELPVQSDHYQFVDPKSYTICRIVSLELSKGI